MRSCQMQKSGEWRVLENNKVGWMVSVAIYADKIDHHTEWSNVYNRVKVKLVTHDLGSAISTWDVDLARKMDELAAS